MTVLYVELPRSSQQSTSNAAIKMMMQQAQALQRQSAVGPSPRLGSSRLKPLRRYDGSNPNVYTAHTRIRIAQPSVDVSTSSTRTGREEHDAQVHLQGEALPDGEPAACNWEQECFVPEGAGRRGRGRGRHAQRRARQHCAPSSRDHATCRMRTTLAGPSVHASAASGSGNLHANGVQPAPFTATLNPHTTHGMDATCPTQASAGRSIGIQWAQRATWTLHSLTPSSCWADALCCGRTVRAPGTASRTSAPTGGCMGSIQQPLQANLQWDAATNCIDRLYAHGSLTPAFLRPQPRALSPPPPRPRRLAPLSEGKVVGDTIQCSYHGWRFQGDGSCVSIPQVGRGGEGMEPTYVFVGAWRSLAVLYCGIKHTHPVPFPAPCSICPA